MASTVTDPTASLLSGSQRSHSNRQRGQRDGAHWPLFPLTFYVFRMGVKHLNDRDYGRALKYWTNALRWAMQWRIIIYQLCIRIRRCWEGQEKGSIPCGGGCNCRPSRSRRFNHGYNEWENERFLRAAKHLIIAAILGHDSLQALKEYYKDELVSKDDFVAAFHAHQAAVMLQRVHRGRRPRKSMQQIVHRRTQSRIMHDMTLVYNIQHYLC